MKRLRLLITGACGVTSRSVVRSLKISKKFKNSVFIGTDICENEYGLYEGLYKKIYRVPPHNNKKYYQVMEKIIKKEQIEAAIVIPELEVLHWVNNPFKVKVFLPPPKFVKTVINKENLYKTLKDTGLIPKFSILNKSDLLNNQKIGLKYPVWLRTYNTGVTSGLNSLLAYNYNQIQAWFHLHPKIKSLMVSDYLPGSNLVCHLLFDQGKLLKTGMIERFAYFMSKVSVSGITGNSSKFKLINDEKVTNICLKAVDYICQKNNEKMNGMIAIDLKGNRENKLLITEINVRHNALTSSYAMAGFNLSEFHLLCTLNRQKEINRPLIKKYPKNNMGFRDIDGLPVYIRDYQTLLVGQHT